MSALVGSHSYIYRNFLRLLLSDRSQISSISAYSQFNTSTRFQAVLPLASAVLLTSFNSLIDISFIYWKDISYANPTSAPSPRELKEMKPTSIIKVLLPNIFVAGALAGQVLRVGTEIPIFGTTTNGDCRQHWTQNQWDLFFSVSADICNRSSCSGISEVNGGIFVESVFNDGMCNTHCSNAMNEIILQCFDTSHGQQTINTICAWVSHPGDSNGPEKYQINILDAAASNFVIGNRCGP